MIGCLKCKPLNVSLMVQRGASNCHGLRASYPCLKLLVNFFSKRFFFHSEMNRIESNLRSAGQESTGNSAAIFCLIGSLLLLLRSAAFSLLKSIVKKAPEVGKTEKKFEWKKIKLYCFSQSHALTLTKAHTHMDSHAHLHLHTHTRAHPCTPINKHASTHTHSYTANTLVHQFTNTQAPIHKYSTQT